MIYIPTTSLCAEFLPLVLGPCVSAANSKKRRWNQISAARKSGIWIIWEHDPQICVGHAAVWWIQINLIFPPAAHKLLDPQLLRLYVSLWTFEFGNVLWFCNYPKGFSQCFEKICVGFAEQSVRQNLLNLNCQKLLGSTLTPIFGLQRCWHHCHFQMVGVLGSPISRWWWLVFSRSTSSHMDTGWGDGWLVVFPGNTWPWHLVERELRMVYEKRCANIWVLLFAFSFPFPPSKLQSVRNGSETSCHDALSDWLRSFSARTTWMLPWMHACWEL